jgi:hypothetical protein
MVPLRLQRKLVKIVMTTQCATRMLMVKVYVNAKRVSMVMELLNAKVSVYKKGIIKYHAVGTVPKSNRIIIEKYPYTQIHDRSTAWLGTGT